MPNDINVLDIGPATGLFMTLLRELGFERVEGLEISPVFRELLRSKNLKVHPGDIISGEGLEQLSPPYDAVVMMEVLEHLENPDQALRNVKKLVAREGIVYLTVPICDCIFERLRRVKSGMSRKEQILKVDETHVQAFTPESFKNLLAREGFELIELKRVSFKPPFLVNYYPGKRMFLLMRALLPGIFRGLILTAIAKPKDKSTG